MIHTLVRQLSDRDATIGNYYIDGRLECFTLEDERREEKVMHETRIPEGLYELKLLQVLTPKTEDYRKKYNWFEWFVEIADVEGFSNVYVHIGNRESHTSGCVLVGDTLDKETMFLGKSTQAFERWYEITVAELKAGRRVMLHIRDRERAVK